MGNNLAEGRGGLGRGGGPCKGPPVSKATSGYSLATPLRASPYTFALRSPETNYRGLIMIVPFPHATRSPQWRCPTVRVREILKITISSCPGTVLQAAIVVKSFLVKREDNYLSLPCPTQFSRLTKRCLSLLSNLHSAILFHFYIL